MPPEWRLGAYSMFISLSTFWLGGNALPRGTLSLFGDTLSKLHFLIRLGRHAPERGHEALSIFQVRSFDLSHAHWLRSRSA